MKKSVLAFLKGIVSVVAVLVFVIVISGCQKQEGAMEKAGEKVDKAVEKAGKKVSEGADKTVDAVKKAADKVEEKVKK
jgi:hyperosmotically inducible protein